MERNITLRLDDAVLQQARHIAVEQRTSLSAWVAELIRREVSRETNAETVRDEALAALEEGFSLGSAPETHSQRS
jgi:predicted transcriptional regulator